MLRSIVGTHLQQFSTCFTHSSYKNRQFFIGFDIEFRKLDCSRTGDWNHLILIVDDTSNSLFLMLCFLFVVSVVVRKSLKNLFQIIWIQCQEGGPLLLLRGGCGTSLLAPFVQRIPFALPPNATSKCLFFHLSISIRQILGIYLYKYLGELYLFPLIFQFV